MAQTAPSESLPKLWIRLPLDVKKWLAAQARRNASSQTSEIVRSLRERMDREAEAQADRKSVAKRTAEETSFATATPSRRVQRRPVATR